MAEYIRWLRRAVGHETIILNFAAAVIECEGRLLLQLRGDRRAWGFLGGAIEVGESAEEAVIREVAEESGLAIQVERLLGVYTKYVDVYPNGDRAQTMTAFFVCSVVRGAARANGNETLDLQYFDLGDLPPLVNQQHRDACDDFLAGRSGVYR